MTEANWDPHRCNEKSGFLFDHACKYGPVANCGRCERPVCNDHLRDDDNGQPVCITCAKKELKDLGRNQQVRKRGFGRHSRWHDHDPYFYGGWGHYGHGYWGHQNYQHAMHRDDVDFTEADSSGLDDGDAADFESDMSES